MADKTALSLRSIPNKCCRKNCNKEDRQLITEEGICKNTSSVIDGAIIRCVGEWSREKIHWLVRYFSIFALGMSKKWTGLNYVEICCGPGRCVIRENGEEIDGTSLAIINHDFFNFFKKAIFIDNNGNSVEALNSRIKDLGKGDIAESVIGDYNDIRGIKEILSNIPRSCLNLVFIDPTDCSIPFSLVEALSSTLKHADFIINVATGTDVNRNIKQAVLDPHFRNAKQKYVGFLGKDDFFNNQNVVEAANQDDYKKMRYLFVEEYKKNLGAIGYTHTGSERVLHYYDLLFASKDSRGLDFWRKTQHVDHRGQTRLDF